MIILEDLLYTEEHMWVKPDENSEKAVIGITDYGQERIGMVSSVDLPSPGDEFVETDVFATVENSVGEVTELLCPISGRVLTTNEMLLDAPEAINDDPYDDGWMVVMDVAQPEELDDLMTPEDYEKYVEELKIKDEEILAEEDEDILEVEE